MTSASDAKAFEKLDHQLESLKSQRAMPDCGTYTSIRPQLVNVIDVINALPAWLKPAWANTLVSALKTLMSMLDQFCPQGK